MKRHGGLLLLPVALVLAVTAALSWMMVRDGALRSAAVDAEYDSDAARYLAEGALALARWQNDRRNCGIPVAFGSLAMTGGTLKTNGVQLVAGGISIDVSSLTLRGGANRIMRVVPMHNSAARTEVALGPESGTDSYVRNGGGGSSTSYLELTDNLERGLIQFSLAAIPPGALIVSSELRLTLFNIKAAAPIRTLSLQRLTRSWSADTATWTYPWTTPGGDYIATPVATIPIADLQQYSVRLDALVDGWYRQALPNYGVLLASSGLTEARFVSLDSSSNPPQLVVRYYPRCLL